MTMIQILLDLWSGDFFARMARISKSKFYESAFDTMLPLCEESLASDVVQYSTTTYYVVSGHLGSGKLLHL